MHWKPLSAAIAAETVMMLVFPLWIRPYRRPSEGCGGGPVVGSTDSWMILPAFWSAALMPFVPRSFWRTLRISVVWRPSVMTDRCTVGLLTIIQPLEQN